MDIVIRAGLPGEAAFLGQLALRSKAHWGYSASFLEASRAELSYTPRQIGSAALCVAVAECDRRVAGFYALRNEPSGVFELEALFVDPEFIGNGIGRASLNHASHAAAGLGGKVMVIQSDPHAARFYEAAGAERSGNRESASIPGRLLPVFRLRLPRHDDL